MTRRRSATARGMPVSRRSRRRTSPVMNCGSHGAWTKDRARGQRGGQSGSNAVPTTKNKRAKAPEPATLCGWWPRAESNCRHPHFQFAAIAFADVRPRTERVVASSGCRSRSFADGRGGTARNWARWRSEWRSTHRAPRLRAGRPAPHARAIGESGVGLVVGGHWSSGARPRERGNRLRNHWRPSRVSLGRRRPSTGLSRDRSRGPVARLRRARG